MLMCVRKSGAGRLGSCDLSHVEGLHFVRFFCCWISKGQGEGDSSMCAFRLFCTVVNAFLRWFQLQHYAFFCRGTF